MPTGTTVHRCFQNVRRKRGDASAARICQSSTGLSLKTGQPPKTHCECGGKCSACKAHKHSEGGNGARIEGAEIFRVGTHKGKEYTSADLDDMIANFERSSTSDAGPHVHVPIFTVPGAIGHEEEQAMLKRTDLPAAGWVSRVYRHGPVLKADFDNVDAHTENAIRNKRYRTISSEVYDEPPPGIVGKGKMLRRVAFLGAEVPQLKNLKDIPMPVKNSERPGYWQRVELPNGRCVAKFCEGGSMPRKFMAGRKRAAKFCAATGKPGICSGQAAGGGLRGANPFRPSTAQGTTTRSAVAVTQTHKRARLAKSLGTPGAFKPAKFCQATKKPGPCKGSGHFNTPAERAAVTQATPASRVREIKARLALKAGAKKSGSPYVTPEHVKEAGRKRNELDMHHRSALLSGVTGMARGRAYVTQKDRRKTSSLLSGKKEQGAYYGKWGGQAHNKQLHPTIRSGAMEQNSPGLHAEKRPRKFMSSRCATKHSERRFIGLIS